MYLSEYKRVLVKYVIFFENVLTDGIYIDIGQGLAALQWEE